MKYNQKKIPNHFFLIVEIENNVLNMTIFVSVHNMMFYKIKFVAQKTEHEY